MTDKGLFSFDAATTRGPLLASAAEASSLLDGLSQHANLDRTGYTFIHRSFGTGSIAGFTSFTHVKSPSSYPYQEQGLSSTISCYYNETVADEFVLDIIETGEWGALVQAKGYGPFDNEYHYTLYHVITMQDSFSWLPQYDNTTRTLAIQMITGADPNETNDGWAFHQFNNIQCDLSYTAHMFDVLVNVTSQTIISSPSTEKTPVWPAHWDAVISAVSTWLWSLTYTDGCIGGCQLGRSLRLNADLLSNSTKSSNNDTLLKATEDYLGSMTDNILINLILTRMVSNAAQSTTGTEALVTVPAIIFGDLTLIIVVNVLNILIFIIYTWQLIRTKVWVDLPPFDLSNICHIIIGSTRGGMKISGGHLSKGEQPNDTTAVKKVGTEQTIRIQKDSAWNVPHEDFLSDSTLIQMRYDPFVTNVPALVPLLNEDCGVTVLIDVVPASPKRRRKTYQTAASPLLDR